MSSTNYTPNKPFSLWLSKATPYVKQQLEVLAQTTESMFRQWASGRRQCSAEKAGLVESATLQIAKTIPGAPEALTRGDMCDACAKCEYFRAGCASVDVDDHK